MVLFAGAAAEDAEDAAVAEEGEALAEPDDAAAAELEAEGAEADADDDADALCDDADCAGAAADKDADVEDDPNCPPKSTQMTMHATTATTAMMPTTRPVFPFLGCSGCGCDWNCWTGCGCGWNCCCAGCAGACARGTW